jgi:sarcosine oxidase subunit beta
MPARPAARGVDIIQNCEVTGIRRDADGSVVGVETSRASSAKKVGVSAAGHTPW